MLRHATSLAFACRGQPLCIARYVSQEVKSRPSESMRKSNERQNPTKFTSSNAYVNYRATDNFYGGDDRDLPKSHNQVISISMILGIYYLIFLRDDIENDGGKNLLQPLHETVPSLAIPILEAAIAENKKFGYNTEKLEKKLEEMMKEPDKHGGGRRSLIEN